ncbi:MAG: carboxypeptidase regulatory-like domain-containing protein, partial [Acidobacteria bacterium]|nr:carboxypeptidase regulatory-like domain-containing protein [Acidobacteriota bacterium]
MRRKKFSASILLAVLFLISPVRGFAQTTGGTVRGTITLADGGTALHNVIVNIVQLKRSTDTDENGAYEFQNVPPGTYTILAHMEGFPDATQRVTLAAGAITTLDFE